MCEIMEEIKNDGIQQGLKQNKIETALNLLAMNTLTIDDIAKATGLTLEEVKELAEKKIV